MEEGLEGEEVEAVEFALRGEAFWEVGEMAEGVGFFSEGQVIQEV